MGQLCYYIEVTVKHWLSHLRDHWRLSGLVILAALQLLYFPINRLIQGGVVLKIPLDDHIPLWPIWIVPYLLFVVWWVTCLVWAACSMEKELFRAFVISAASVMLISYAIYIVYPTYVVRPTVTGSSWEWRLLDWIYRHDRAYNAFPSSHTYSTMLVFFYWLRWYPRKGWLWGAISVMILCSTLLVHQHYVPDLIGGISLAWLGYRLGLWWASRYQKGE
jgi:membrane-associated phospholipid phosphatase